MYTNIRISNVNKKNRPAWGGTANHKFICPNTLRHIDTAFLLTLGLTAGAVLEIPEVDG